MRTSEVAAQAHVNAQTLRYYERRGLLPEPVRTPSGYRDYGDDAVPSVVTIDVRLTGSGPLATFRTSNQYKMPSQFNGHDSYRGTERAATGSIVAGSLIDATFSSADMLQVTWSSHSNS